VFAQIVSDNWYHADIIEIDFRSVTITTKRLTPATATNATTNLLRSDRGKNSCGEAFCRVDKNCHARTAALSRYDLSAKYLSTNRALHDVSKPEPRISYRTNRGAESTTFGYRQFLRTRDGRDAGINALQLLALDLYCPRTCCSFSVSITRQWQRHFNKNISDFLRETRLCSNWTRKLLCLFLVYFQFSGFFTYQEWIFWARWELFKF